MHHRQAKRILVGNHLQTAEGAVPPLSSLIRLSSLPRHIPPSRGSKPRHVSTVYRYVLRGVRGIRLDAWRLPDGLYTSLSAWERFVERLTAAGPAGPALPSETPTQANPKRQNLVESEIDVIRASIGRSAR